MKLKENLERAKFIISFLDQENNQLKEKKLVMEKDNSKPRNKR